MNKTLANLFIVLGVFFLILTFFLIWERSTPRRLAFNSIELATQTNKDLKIQPVSLTVPALKLELPIFSQDLKNGTWPTTSEGVTYLTSTPLPGETGNSILYGHNWPNLLGKLPKLKPGQMLEITFNDATTKQFQVEFTSIVTPDQTHILNQTPDRRLTLYTCTGFLDSQRFVVTAITK